MPCIGFQDPNNKAPVSFDEAPNYFEDAGIMPGEAIGVMIDDLEGERSECSPLYTSPSKLCPQTTCRREQVIKAFLPYRLSPYVLWNANEGTFWHTTFRASDHRLKGWLANELRVPGGEPDCENGLLEPGATHPDVVLCEDGKNRVEVYPGILLRGTIDRMTDDRPPDPIRAIADHKTTRFPKVGFKSNRPSDRYMMGGQYLEENRREWAFQQNAYAHITEIITGQTVEQLWVWRMFRGSRSEEDTFLKVPIPKRTVPDQWAALSKWAPTMLEALKRCHDITEEAKAKDVDPAPALREYIGKNVPMDGHNLKMFNNTKCTRYCPVKEICFGMAGFVDF